MELKEKHDLSWYIKRCGESANKKGWNVTWESFPEYNLAAIAELVDAFEKGWRKNNIKKAEEEIGDCLNNFKYE